jgi:hypothetical protein
VTKMFSLSLALIMSFGCGASRLKRANHLLDDVRRYHDGIRWGKLAQAAVRLPPAERDAFVNEREELGEDLRIADYELVRVRYVKGQMRAKVRVQYIWHLDSRGIVHKTWADQMWERLGKRWILRDEHRAHGEPMPGLAEPPPEAAGGDDSPVAARRNQK